uniref:Uncharacterized protein n=1 Tax=Tanacetum cinerariifolium TaxID=118510 RepID=A0A699H978_TANCI|nr:hypothetical protein [Tanacetum cinerariifolium]
MIDYVLEKYENNWQVDDAIADEILDDLLKRERDKQQRVKAIFVDDKRKGIFERIENVEKDLNKAKEKMDLNKGKEKMVMERGNTSFEHIA